MGIAIRGCGFGQLLCHALPVLRIGMKATSIRRATSLTHPTNHNHHE
jgi:hypothetical protein